RDRGHYVALCGRAPARARPDGIRLRPFGWRHPHSVYFGLRRVQLLPTHRTTAGLPADGSSDNNGSTVVGAAERAASGYPRTRRRVFDATVALDWRGQRDRAVHLHSAARRRRTRPGVLQKLAQPRLPLVRGDSGDYAWLGVQVL